MATRLPPRFVPTLTEVVQPGAAPLAGTPAVSAEQLAQRVLQRVDLVLERRVREAIATVVLDQSSQLAPLLRERVDAVVREVVTEALADEMRARQRDAGPST